MSSKLTLDCLHKILLVIATQLAEVNELVVLQELNSLLPKK